MLNGRGILCGIFFVFFVVSAAFGQNVEVLKAELKGMEGRLDAKIDGVKNELNAKIEGTEGQLDAKIDGVKNELNASINGAKGELNASINGVKSGVTIIQWIIGGAGVAFTIFLGFVGYLLNYFVKQQLPKMLQSENRTTDQPQPKPTSGEGFADNAQFGYPLAEGEPQ